MGDGGFSLWQIIEQFPDGGYKERYVGHFDPQGVWHSDVMARPRLGGSSSLLHPAKFEEVADVMDDLMPKTPNPPAQPEIPTGGGYPDESTDNPPEAGNLPILDGVQWERKRDGALEAWHSPDGKRNRAGKTYIGRIGKRQLASWEAKPPAQFRALISEWISEKRMKKGI